MTWVPFVKRQPAFICFVCNGFSKQNGNGLQRCQTMSVVPTLVFEGWGVRLRLFLWHGFQESVSCRGGLWAHMVLGML